jgi:hypothetical protein
VRSLRTARQLGGGYFTVSRFPTEASNGFPALPTPDRRCIRISRPETPSSNSDPKVPISPYHLMSSLSKDGPAILQIFTRRFA